MLINLKKFLCDDQFQFVLDVGYKHIEGTVYVYITNIKHETAFKGHGLAGQYNLRIVLFVEVCYPFRGYDFLSFPT